MLMLLIFQLLNLEIIANSFTKIENKMGFTNKTKKYRIPQIDNKLLKNKKYNTYYFRNEKQVVFQSRDCRNWKETSTQNENVFGNDNINQPIIINPNPATDKSEINGFIGKDYEIYTLYGLKIQEGKLNKIIDIENLTRGIYFLKIENKIQKFIKY